MKLARVKFRDAVECPGKYIGMSVSPEKSMSKPEYVLEYREGANVVSITGAEGTVLVPLTNVVNMVPEPAQAAPVAAVGKR